MVHRKYLINKPFIALERHHLILKKQLKSYSYLCSSFDLTSYSNLLLCKSTLPCSQFTLYFGVQCAPSFCIKSTYPRTSLHILTGYICKTTSHNHPRCLYLFLRQRVSTLIFETSASKQTKQMSSGLPTTLGAGSIPRTRGVPGAPEGT